MGPGTLETSASTNIDVSVANSRGRRAVKVPSRLVVGNSEGWHFNRAEGR